MRVATTLVLGALGVVAFLVTSCSKSSDAGSSGGAGSACLGASLLGALGRTKMIVGGAMADSTANLAPFDVRYEYVAGGLQDGPGPCPSCLSCTAKGVSCTSGGGGGCDWWGCYQDDQVPPGRFVSGFAASNQSATPPRIPMFTYYQFLQASGANEGADEIAHAADAGLMSRYLADWRFLLQQVGMATALLHVEPDFWGYAQQQTNDATAVPAAVASANPTDCGGQPNTIAGLGKCMIAMVRRYAPNAKVGLQASVWATKLDPIGDASVDATGEAKKVAAFLAACGGGGSDFVVVETSDRDGGYYETVEHKRATWDAANSTLPNFHRDFEWVKALTEALGVPALYWQTPLGNAAQNDTPNHYTDNRVDYFFTHMGELARAHAVGALFGAGAGDQTSPESDGSNFVDKAKAYFAAGGQQLCP
jgi:hypothetical protein